MNVWKTTGLSFWSLSSAALAGRKTRQYVNVKRMARRLRLSGVSVAKTCSRTPALKASYSGLRPRANRSPGVGAGGQVDVTVDMTGIAELSEGGWLSV